MSGGVWPPMVGTGLALGNFGVHRKLSVLQNCVVVSQSASLRQPPIGPHRLLPPQKPLRQTGLAPGVHGPRPSG